MNINGSFILIQVAIYIRVIYCADLIMKKYHVTQH